MRDSKSHRSRDVRRAMVGEKAVYKGLKGLRLAIYKVNADDFTCPAILY